MSLLTLLINQVQRLLLRILAHGPVPRHVAFVMDGNRRYARARGIRVEGGHGEGFESLKRTLELCFHLRIPTITVYAFSIDNFNRPPEEVDAIMRLAKEGLMRLADEGELLHRHSVRLNLLGRRELLPSDVREGIERVENMTRENHRATLNICCPYTSRDEITTAVNSFLAPALHSVPASCPSSDGRSRPLVPITSARTDESDLGTPSLSSASSTSSTSSDSNPAELSHSRPPSRTRNTSSDGAVELGSMTEGKIFDRLSTSLVGAPPLDILVRTSDVRRLSDFMLWQCNKDTQLHFVRTFWPEFGIRDMLPILLDYQQKIWMRRVGVRQ